MSRLNIRKVAVLGAGVMGAKIAAHCANADVSVILFDLASNQGDPNGIVRKAIAGLKKLEPAPFAARDRAQYVECANYGSDLERLQECDLVIEAIAERMEWKLDLFAKVAPHLKPGAIFASNTSSLSINALAIEGMPAERHSRFCGIHFFNPPRYLPLVELIPTADTDPAMLDAMEAWLTSRLGKNVIRAKDTPSFVANRVGVFSILSIFHHAERLGLAFDEVDLLTGVRIGRPKSGTFRTIDVVGLDTVAHVIHSMQATLADDPWSPHFRTPAWLQALIEKDALGQKSGGGIYRKAGKRILMLDPNRGEYVEGVGAVAEEVESILKIEDPRERLKALADHPHPQSQFLWSIFRDVFHYCAVHLGAIAGNARDVDLAMRWGFGWNMGPFETWQAAGWREIAGMIAADIAHGRTMSGAPLPPWVLERDGVHQPGGSWSAAEGTLEARVALPVYGRQLYPDRVLGEAPPERGELLWENGGVRLWRRPDKDAGIGIVSITARVHAIGGEVMDGMLEAIARAESDLDGLVIWHEAPFAVGANLMELTQACRDGQLDLIERMVAKFQHTSMAIKHAQVPVIAAVQGMALGGGCEFAMHAAHRVLGLESHLGLVEAGVGLIPAGGGCKELALRADRLSRCATTADVFPYIEPAFRTITRATVSKSALEAIELGFACRGDDIVFQPQELLYVALRRARAMAEAGWHPRLPNAAVKVAGRNGIATCEMTLVNMVEGGFISAHDYTVARAAAVALCGGEVDAGREVSEQWLLDVERAQFVGLLRTEQTRQRIAHMLETGKPLRN
jgi:3-hydroxyacyl-CoA dehydrogenase